MLSFRNIKLSVIFSFIIIMLPFFYQYRGISNIISFGEALLIPIITVFLFKLIREKNFECNSSFVLFYVITIITTLCCFGFDYFQISRALTIGFRMVFYAICILFMRRYYRFNAVYKLYYAICFGFSIYLILQYICHYLFNIYLPFHLGYDLLFPIEARGEDYKEFYMWGYRASSLFLEPSYFSFFTLPCFALLLYDSNKKFYHYLDMATIIIALLISTAGSGILGLFAIIGMYLWNSNSTKAVFISKFFIFLFIVAIFSLVYIYAENTNYILGRMASGGSFNQRVLRGILIYLDLPVINQIIGVGLNNLGAYMEYYGMYTEYDENNLNYGSTLVQTLNFSGAVGFFSLMLLLIKIYKDINNFEKNNVSYKYFNKGIFRCIFVLMILIMSYESIMFMYRFCFLYSFIIGLKNMILDEGVCTSYA